MKFSDRALLALALLIPATISLLAGTAQASPQVDTTFGGRVGVSPKLYPGSRHEQAARAAAVQAGGRVVVPLSLAFALGPLERRPVIRLHADGSRDYSFGSRGAAWIRVPGERYVTLRGIATTGADELVVWGFYAGTSELGWSGDFDGLFIARLTPDGILDRSFGDQGVRKLSTRKFFDSGFFSFEGDHVGVGLRGDGGATVSRASEENGGQSGLALANLSPNGEVQAAAGGKALSRILLRRDRQLDFAVVSGNWLYVLSTEYRSGHFRCVVQRFDARSGAADDQFGVLATRRGNLTCNSISLPAGGGVIVAGSHLTKDDRLEGFVAKLGPDGRLVDGFGTDGTVTVVGLEAVAQAFEVEGGAIAAAGFRRGDAPAIVSINPWPGAGGVTTRTLVKFGGYGNFAPATEAGGAVHFVVQRDAYKSARATSAVIRVRP